MKDTFELIMQFVGEYFVFFFNTLINKDSWFDTIDIERQNRNGTKIVKTVNPKLIIFSLFSLIIGSILLNTIAKKNLSDLTQFAVIAIVLWIIWSVIIYLICIPFNLKSTSFFQSLSISFQVFGVVYVLSSLITILYSAIIGYTFSDKLLVFFLAQVILLTIYLTFALINNYEYKFKLLPILVGGLSSFICVYINYRTFSRLDLPFPAIPPETKNIAILDISSIPKDKTAYALLKNSDSLDLSLIYFVSDSIKSVIIKDKHRDIDSLFKKIKYGKSTKILSIATLLNDIKPLRTIHVFSNFNTKWESIDRQIYCDTLFVHLTTSDSPFGYKNSSIDLLDKENELRFMLRNLFYYKKFVLQLYKQ